MKLVSGFCLNFIKFQLSSDSVIGITYKSSTIVDFFDGYLWLWSSLPIGVDRNDGKLVIEGIDDIAGGIKWHQ
jgi:hypothetical protein